MRLIEETVWGLVRVGEDSRPEVAYVLGGSPYEVWKKVVEGELLGTGHTRPSLTAEGWYATKIGILVP